MNSLPELVRGPIHYRLPLEQETAFRLADLLLAESAQQRAERLETALLRDAALAIWAILAAPEPASPAAPLAALVAWLEPRIARLLAQGMPAAHGGDNPRQSKFDGLLLPAHRSIVTAAHTAGSVDHDRQFRALVATAVEWLIECGEPCPDRRNAAQALPSWLARSLEQAAGQGPLPADDERGGKETFAVASPESAEMLRRLAARSVRLAELETDFAGAVEREKLAALKEFAYGAGHEINNPLANISARAQTLLKDEHDPERRQKLAAINTQAFRAHEMIADLMLFAQPPEWKADRVAIAPLVAELESAWRRQASDQQTTLNVQIADPALAAWADRSALAVALRALVANALEAVGRGGTIELAAAPARLALDATADGSTTDSSARGDSECADRAMAGSPADAVAICVRDDGPGIDPAVRPRIFDPFYSGREAGRGLGFGLPKCWRIATALGGRIDVAGGSPAGATFTLVLPLAPAGRQID